MFRIFFGLSAIQSNAHSHIMRVSELLLCSQFKFKQNESIDIYSSIRRRKSATHLQLSKFEEKQIQRVMQRLGQSDNMFENNKNHLKGETRGKCVQRTMS